MLCLGFAFFSNSKGSYQKGILMSLLWLPPTRFVHGFLCCFSYKAGNLICGRNSSPTCHYCVEIWAAEVFSIIKIVLEKRIFESYNMIDLYHHIQAMDQIWVINLQKKCIGLLGKKKDKNCTWWRIKMSHCVSNDIVHSNFMSNTPSFLATFIGFGIHFHYSPH